MRSQNNQDAAPAVKLMRSFYAAYDRYFRPLMGIAMAAGIFIGGLLLSNWKVSFRDNVTSLGDERWLQLTKYAADLAKRDFDSKLKEVMERARQEAVDRELSIIKEQNQAIAVSVSAMRLETVSRMDKIADLIEKIRTPIK